MRTPNKCNSIDAAPGNARMIRRISSRFINPAPLTDYKAFSLRQAKITIRASSNPWRKREICVLP
jgi:hypothetical protein